MFSRPLGFSLGGPETTVTFSILHHRLVRQRGAVQLGVLPGLGYQGGCTGVVVGPTHPVLPQGPIPNVLPMVGTCQPVHGARAGSSGYSGYPPRPPAWSLWAHASVPNPPVASLSSAGPSFQCPRSVTTVKNPECYRKVCIRPAIVPGVRKPCKKRALQKNWEF